MLTSKASLNSAEIESILDLLYEDIERFESLSLEYPEESSEFSEKARYLYKIYEKIEKVFDYSEAYNAL